MAIIVDIFQDPDISKLSDRTMRRLIHAERALKIPDEMKNPFFKAYRGSGSEEEKALFLIRFEKAETTAGQQAVIDQQGR